MMLCGVITIKRLGVETVGTDGERRRTVANGQRRHTVRPRSTGKYVNIWRGGHNDGSFVYGELKLFHACRWPEYRCTKII